jgi:hypothetical protein
MMRILIAFLALALLLGCLGPRVMSVSELGNSTADYLGEKVYVKGTVKDTIKFGKLSGFKLVEGNDSILVSSDELPKEGSEVTVQGTVMKETLFGYYVLAKEIN